MARPKNIDWSNVDWSLANTEIANQLNISPSTVRLRRIKLSIPPARKRGEVVNRRSGRKPINDLDYEFPFTSKGAGLFKPSRHWMSAVKRLKGDACQLCGYHRPPVSNHVHHILPMSEGGKNTIRNGMVLCSRCHDEVHAGVIMLISDDQLSKLHLSRILLSYQDGLDYKIEKNIKLKQKDWLNDEYIKFQYLTGIEQGNQQLPLKLIIVHHQGDRSFIYCGSLEIAGWIRA